MKMLLEVINLNINKKGVVEVECLLFNLDNNKLQRLLFKNKINYYF